MSKRTSLARIAAVTLASVLLVSCIPSSGGGGGAGSEGQADNHITWFYPGGEQPVSKKQWRSDVARFEKAHPDITVKVLPVPWDLAHDRLVNMVRAGNPPDVIQMGSRWIPELVAMDALAPLSDDFGQQKLDAFYPSILETVRYQEKLYALPRLGSTKALFYRKDLISEPPETWKELVDTAKKVQREQSGMKGFAMAGATDVTTAGQFLTLLYTFGGEVYDEQGNVVLNSPAAVRALELEASLYRKHEIMPNPLEYNREQFPQLFKAEQIAMFVGGPWSGPSISENPDNKKTPYAVAPVPEGPAGTATVVITDSTGISAASEDKEAATAFLDFITGKKEFVRRGTTVAKALPLGPEIASDPKVKTDDYLQTFIDMTEFGHKAPQPRLWEPFQDIMVEMVQSVYVGSATPEEAVRTAAKRIKEKNLEPVTE